MQGKICMVTGANTGMGKVTALELAKRGASVVMVCRDRAKGEEAQREIRRESGNESVDLLLADLSSQQAVHHLAQEFGQHYTQLHILINNAGAIFPHRRVSVDGLEMSLAINYLAVFLLTNLLLDTLKASTSARIINLASTTQTKSIHLDDLQSQKTYQGLDVYGRSKLAIVLLTYHLAELLNGASVTVNCVHPGSVATHMTESGIDALPLPLKPLKLFTGPIKRLLITPEQGIQTALYVATSPEVEGVTGKYFFRCKVAPTVPASYDRSLQEHLWEISETLTGLNTKTA
ncbi:MAG: SDR family oxidoreductase [Ktedonobacteraceae bacterium]